MIILFINSHFSIDASLRETIYCTAVAEGGQKEWDFLYERLRNSKDSTERDIILKSLGCSKKMWIRNVYVILF